MPFSIWSGSARMGFHQSAYSLQCAVGVQHRRRALISGHRWLETRSPFVCASAAALSQPVTPPIIITSGMTKSEAGASMACCRSRIPHQSLRTELECEPRAPPVRARRLRRLEFPCWIRKPATLKLQEAVTGFACRNSSASGCHNPFTKWLEDSPRAPPVSSLSQLLPGVALHSHSPMETPPCLFPLARRWRRPLRSKWRRPCPRSQAAAVAGRWR